MAEYVTVTNLPNAGTDAVTITGPATYSESWKLLDQQSVGRDYTAVPVVNNDGNHFGSTYLVGAARATFTLLQHDTTVTVPKGYSDETAANRATGGYQFTDPVDSNKTWLIAKVNHAKTPTGVPVITLECELVEGAES